MNLIRRIVLAGGGLLAMTAQAAAEPFTLSVFLFNATFLGSFLSFSAVYTIASLLPAIIGAAIAVGGALLNRPRNQQLSPSTLKTVFQTSEGSEIRAVGRVRVGGLQVYGNTSLGVTRYRLIAHTKGPIDAVEEHYLGGRSVTVDPDGTVTSPPWAKPALDSWVRIFSKVGDGTETAWTQLTSAFPDHWTNAHRLQGIAQSLVIYGSPGVNDPYFGKLYQSGEPPYDRVQRAELVYDPRTATTAWSDNGILCAAHIMRSYPDVEFDDFDWSDIAYEAGRADQLVATLTGYEERARCSGFWQSETKRGDVMADVLQSIGAELTLSPTGKIRIRLVDDIRTPRLTFTSRHIIEWTWKSGPDAVERPNVCRVSYYSPERNYEMADIDLTGIAWARDELEIERYGEKVYDVVLPFCPSAAQAQRIARRMFYLARGNTGVIKTNMAGVAAWDESVVAIEYPDDMEETPTCIIAPPRVDDAAGTVEIPFVEQPALAAWSPATDEAAAPEQIPELSYEAALEQPTTVVALVVLFTNGATTETRFRYSLPAGEDIATVEAVYRLYTAGAAGSWSSMTEVDLTAADSPPLVETFAYANGYGANGQEADLRVRIFNADGDGSYWSETLNVVLAYDNTAPGMPIVVTDGNHNAMDFDATTSIDDLQTVSVRLRRRFFVYPGPYGSWEDRAGPSDLRPGTTVQFSDSTPGVVFDFGDKIEWQVVPRTSNGTEGTPFSIELEPIPWP